MRIRNGLLPAGKVVGVYEGNWEGIKLSRLEEARLSCEH